MRLDTGGRVFEVDGFESSVNYCLSLIKLSLTGIDFSKII